MIPKWLRDHINDLERLDEEIAMAEFDRLWAKAKQLRILKDDLRVAVGQQREAYEAQKNQSK